MCLDNTPTIAKAIKPATATIIIASPRIVREPGEKRKSTTVPSFTPLLHIHEPRACEWLRGESVCASRCANEMLVMACMGRVWREEGRMMQWIT